MRLNETPNASGLGHLFFFFSFFSQSRGNAASQQFYGQFGWEKKREKKRQKRQRAELPPCQPTLLLLLTPLPRSPRWCGGLSSPPAALSLPVPMLRPPCQSILRAHAGCNGTVHPSTPLSRDQCTRVFCALPPPSPFLLPPFFLLMALSSLNVFFL